MSYEYGAYKNGEITSINVEDAQAWLDADFAIYRRQVSDDTAEFIEECSSTFGTGENPVEEEETLLEVEEEEDEDAAAAGTGDSETSEESETQEESVSTETEESSDSDTESSDVLESGGWVLVAAAGGTLPDDVIPDTIAEDFDLDLSGLYITDETQEDGSSIYYAHDKMTLEDSTLVWRFLSGAVEVSTDGGQTYPYGFTVTGEMMAKVIETIGLKAEWITSGQLGARYINTTDLFSQDIVFTGSLASTNDQVQIHADGTFHLGTESSYVDFDGTKITVKADEITLSGKTVATQENVEELTAKKADIDFANVLALEASQAVIQQLLVGGGILTEDITAVTGQFTQYLTGVNISGDLITAGTISTERLIIRSSEDDTGIIFAINDEGELDQTQLSAEELKRLTLDGKVITAGTITADKIAVTDLSAFHATIGGFQITDGSIYSGAKESVDSSAQGIYLGNDGQIALGDGDSYIKYYKDTDGTYKLAISAGSISFGGTPETIEETLTNIQDEMETIRDEVTTFLYINSSNGTVFKNDSISTVLTVTIYRGADRIDDIDTLRDLMGDTACLEWSFKRLDEDTIYQIDSGDSRIGSDGFTFTISPDDVDAKAIFMCELIEEGGE